jgi:hypothetical protein
MRRVLLAVVFVVVLLSGVGLAAFPRSSPAPVLSYPCIDSSREGWLTVASNQALMIIEWGPGRGAVKAGQPSDAPRVTATTEADARARARRLFEPPAGARRGSGAGFVSLFVSCDGVGSAWRGTVEGERPGYSQCLRPRHRTRLQCLEDVWADPRRAAPAGTADALAERLGGEAAAQGVSAAPPPDVSRWGLPSLSRGSLTDWFEDEEPDSEVIED